MNEILKKDIVKFVDTFELANSFSDTTFLITGGTGLIGSILIHCLIALDKNIKIVAPIRNREKAYNLFDENERESIRFIECDLQTYNFNIIGSIDYIVHCAAPTSIDYFSKYPVETFNSIVLSSHNLLDYAKDNMIRGFAYISSIEVYGTISDDSTPVTEYIQGYVNPMSVRSCYPIAKRAVENLCRLYAEEYGVNTKVIRLTQTTGAGVDNNDNRILVQFSRKAFLQEDIILHTQGASARSYCYTTDAIEAILYIIINGAKGEAYNVANPDCYKSALELAYYIKENFAPKINVKIEVDEKKGYAPDTKIRLSTDKLYQLGWRPKYSLYDIINNVIASMTCN